MIHDACSNIRDELLFRILYEGGLRIGEALSLWVEDFDIGKNAITVRKSKTSDGEKRKVYVSIELTFLGSPMIHQPSSALSLLISVSIIILHRQNIKRILVISEEVGISKPDKRIFELALNKLNVKPEEALFVGDDLEKDIDGCQNANIKGIWFNPHKIKNDTDIKPYAEIDSFDGLLSYIR